MKEVILKEILHDLRKTIDILEKRETKDVEELKQISDKAIEKVALYKDLDVISITVLIYSIYKTLSCVKPDDYENILQLLKKALDNLNKRKFGAYNGTIKRLYNIIKSCNAKVQQHLQDVMQAARVRKGTVLLQKGLSIGQAAGLMGLSNWDLQQYASKTTAFDQHHEKIPAKTRMKTALQIFGVSK